jgi:hypothetical protein
MWIMSLIVTYAPHRTDSSHSSFSKNAVFPMIDLEILTDDQRKRELIQRYWKLGSSGNDFSVSLKTLKAEFELSRGAILGIVRSNSRAVSRIHQCKCGSRKEFDSRKDFRSTPKQKPYVCQECQEAESGEDAGSGASKPATADSHATSSNASGPKRSEKEAAGPHFKQRSLHDLQGMSPSSNGGSEHPDKDMPEEPQSRQDTSQAPLDLEGEDADHLQDALRQLARVLSETSQRIERLSYQVGNT